jgi:hypothetical protein
VEADVVVARHHAHLGHRRVHGEEAAKSLHIGLKPGLWIRIRIGPGFYDLVDQDPESGSMGKKNEEKNALFLNFLNILIAKKKMHFS